MTSALGRYGVGMKKLTRNPEKFEVLELFSSMAASQGYDLTDPVAVHDFVERVKISIEANRQSKITIFGKRVEALFAYVAGALGKVRLLKQEDSGDLYYIGDNIIAPDYRLTMLDGSQLLVEVKNCHCKNYKKPFFISKEYYEKIRTYSDLNNLDLLFVVYFSSWNYWTLLTIESFSETPKGYFVDFVSAIAKSEMYRLGDCMIGTTPNLEFHLLVNQEKANEIDDSGQVVFIPDSIKIYCANNEVVADLERKIAFYLMRFGNWNCDEECIISNNRMHGIKFTFYPEHQEEGNFSLIGHLSAMVSNGFREFTIKNDEIIALAPSLDPADFGVLIPEGYAGERLPLWRFDIRPNYKFQS